MTDSPLTPTRGDDTMRASAMDLDEARTRLTAVEGDLSAHAFLEVARFSTNDRGLRLAVTERLRKAAKKARVWKSPAFLTAIKNAAHGFDEKRARSVGGADGIYLVDRTFRPKNEMMRKLFDRFLDRPDSGANAIAAALDTDIATLVPVRLVSHHLRLLGVLHRGATEDTLVLVDYDDDKP
jgi:hypothetical protein